MRHRLLTVYNGATVNPLASIPWIAQWKFNDNGNDSIGTNNLTNNNTATFAAGKLSSATQLAAASSQYWSVASNSVLQAGDVPLLLAAWVKLATSGDYGIAGKYNSGANKREYTLRFEPTNGFRFGIGTGTGATWANSGAAGLTTGVWYLVVGWYDPATDTANICVNNGTPQSASIAGGTYVSDSAFVVGGFDSAGFYFDGLIDNVALAKGTGAVPSALQLAALYNNGTGTENFS